MVQTRNLTVMFTDIKGFTERTSQQTRDELMDMLERHHDVVLPVAERHGGDLIKTIGDAFLLTFESPTNGVLAGVAIQEALQAHNEGLPTAQRIEVRVAVNCGEVTLSDGDIYGEPVNIASRIEGLADAGEVYFTEAVYLAMNKREVPSSGVGYRQLKGVPEKIKVYKVLRERPPGGTAPEATPDAAAPEAPATPVDTTASSAPRPAGFWVRGVALLIDFIVFGVIIGGVIDAVLPAPAHDIEIEENESIEVADHRLEIRGKDGDKVVLGPGGVRVVDGDRGVVFDYAGSESDVAGTSSAEASDPAQTRGSTPAATRGPRMKIDHKAGRLNTTIKMMLAVLYLTVFWTLWGATPGKLALGLRVVRRSDLERPEMPRALLRAVFWILSALPLGLGFLWAAWDKDKRAWHDRASDTRVVR